MKAVIVSVQFLVEIPENTPTNEAEAWGIDWLNALASNATEVLDYRHPKIAGVHIRPVPVQVRDNEALEIFSDDNLIQL